MSDYTGDAATGEASLDLSKLPLPEEPKCGEFVCSHIAREGSWFPCVLPKGHDGLAHFSGGNCFTHGPYVSKMPWRPPACPKCNDNIRQAYLYPVMLPLDTGIYNAEHPLGVRVDDPTMVQQLPTAPDTEQDVGRFVVNHLVSMHLPKVAIDHEKRIDFGEKKYGQRLRTNNGRDWLMDCYQEVLDGISYSAQGMLEGDDGWILHDLSLIAGRIREKLETERRRP
jgi:hypothetical protein